MSDTGSHTGSDGERPVVEFGTCWAKVHYRRDVTERDRAAISTAAYGTPVTSEELALAIGNDIREMHGLPAVSYITNSADWARELAAAHAILASFKVYRS